MDYYQSRLEKAEMEPLLSAPYEEGPVPARPRPCHRSDRRRKFRFFFAFIFLYILFRFIISDVAHLTRIFKHRRGYGGRWHGDKNWPYSATVVSDDDWHLPRDMDVGECAAWSEPTEHGRRHRLHSSASLELPLSSEKLFLISRGPLSVGGVHVVQSNATDDVVKITTIVEFNKKKHLNLAQLCLVEGFEGQNGIGIFTHIPENRRRHRRFEMGFHVKVEIPQSADSDFLNIKDFETDMPFFAHNIEDISSKVRFDSVSLHSGFSPIHVEGIAATFASAESKFSPIEGNFVVNKSLVIATSNSPININATLNNHDDDGESTQLTMETSNSPIKANINLVSTSDTSEGGKFKVNAQSSISPVSISFRSAPINSKLELDVHSSLSPATVHLHPTYEGSFDLTTSFGQSQVKFDENEEDPAKRDRKRKVLFDNIGGSTTHGTVEWEDGGKERGKVVIGSSMSPVVLYL